MKRINDTSTKMMTKQQSTNSTADGRIKCEYDKVSLIVESNAGCREEAVMVTLQYTAVADLAVM